MLTQVSVILARAHRHQDAVPICQVSTVEMAVGCIQAAEKKEAALLLSIDQAGFGKLPYEAILDSLQRLATLSPASLGIMVQIEPDQESLKSALAAGAPAIIFKESRYSRKYLLNLTESAVYAGNRLKTEVIGSLYGLATENRLLTYLQQTGVPALSLPISIPKNGQPFTSLNYIKQIAKIARVPLIAQEFPVEKANIKKYAEAGVCAFTLSDVLDQAYTAGLHTGLRRRSSHKPADYLEEAIQAVQENVQAYL